MVTIYFKGTALLTAEPTQKDMVFLATVQHLSKEFKEQGGAA
ncbi:hypothetical protein MAL1_00212 [Bacteriophage DSS3_MAL1]|nr:hypothetical protein MAL1_00212 [Bacteriophage DSS3_MAL1]